MERQDQRANPSHRVVVNSRIRNALVINEPGNPRNNTNNPNNININNINNNNNNVISYRRDLDQLIPTANIFRIMRRILPSHAKISEDSKELLQERTSKFISFITVKANEHCHREYLKTVSAEDIIYALSRFGFDDYVDALTLFLNRYHQSETTQTIEHRDSSMRRTIDFLGAVQPPPLPLLPCTPEIITAVSGALKNNYSQFFQDPGLFSPASTNQYYFQGGSSGVPNAPSESSLTSLLASSLSRGSILLKPALI